MVEGTRIVAVRGDEKCLQPGGIQRESIQDLWTNCACGVKEREESS